MHFKKTAVACKSSAWIGGGPKRLGAATKGVSEKLAKVPADVLVTACKIYGKAATVDDGVGITGPASDSREPLSGVCGANGPGIAKNDGTLC